MPYKDYPDGLYLVSQPGAKRGIDHYGIADLGNRLAVPGADGVHPVIVHQSPPGVRANWLRDTDVWRVLGVITDEPLAIERYHAALAIPAYRLLGNSCEHFARFVATGVRESKQLQAAGWMVGLAAVAIAALNDEPQPARPRWGRRRTSPAREA